MSSFIFYDSSILQHINKTIHTLTRKGFLKIFKKMGKPIEFEALISSIKSVSTREFAPQYYNN